MPSVADFITWIRHSNLLDAAQLDEIARDLEGKFEDPRLLAEHLIERDLLTAYQVAELFRGRGSDLVIGPYRLLHPLGEGAMGQVFKAKHRRLQRVVAIKVIRRERLDAELVRRFQREAQVAAQLNHPNVVLIYDADQHGETHFIAMEYVEGIDLSRLLRERNKPLPVAVACDFARQAALGLQHAHERGMVHRDIKPSNILVTRFREADPGTESDFSCLADDSFRFGLVKILDMGLARLNEGDKNSSFLTQVGTVIGTPDFIAPEQARNSSKVDIRADLYSLGCTLYYLLAGRPPFPEGSVVEKLLMHQLDEPAPVEEYCPGIPDAVVAIVRRLMAKRADDRFQTPKEVADALSALGSKSGSVVNLMKPSGNEEEGTAILTITPQPPAAAPSAGNAPTPAPILPTKEFPPPEAPKTQRPRVPLSGDSLTPPPQRVSEVMDTPVPSGELTNDTSKAASISADDTDKGDANQAKRIAVLSGHVGWVVSLSFSPDRNRLLSGGVDGTVHIWGFSSKLPREQLLPKVHEGEVHAVAFAPDSSTFATASGSLDGRVFLWDVSGEAPRKLTCFESHSAPVEALSFSHNGNLLASGGYDKIIYLWDVNTLDGSRPYTLKGHKSVVSAVAFAPSSKVVASGDQQGAIHLWTVGKIWASEQGVLPGHTGAIR
ncbi:MAG: WD40 repeat domain-containing serine/threonine protein kinase, partial [Gemmataceae bacterium]